MLQTIRERAQGWIAWAIVILISIPFALWGVQSYIGGGSEPVVATVNGVDITERELNTRYQDTSRRLRARLGANYRPELFDEKTMRGQVLDRIIQDNLLLQSSLDMGLRASDRELRTAILSNPSFQKDSRFDKVTYERVLELQGIRPAQFEDNMRQRIISTQLARAIAGSEIATATEIAESVRLDGQQRRIGFVRVPKSDFIGDEPIPDADVHAYYESNLDRFQTPARVTLSYLVLDAEAIDAAQSPPDEMALRALYEGEMDRFRQPEQRRARHILVGIPVGGDEEVEAAARGRIEEIHERVQSGEDFVALAKEFSEDAGSAENGGDLGLFERGLMDPAFDQSAFALALDGLSEPVRSQFGYHLIQVIEIQPETITPFEEVKEQLIVEVAKTNAESLYFDWAERLATLSYENPDSLEPASDALGLELQTSDWIERKGGQGILANRRVIAAAFSDPVLQDGLNSDLIEPERNVLQAVVLRVLEHEEASAKPLEQVREDIVKILKDEHAVAAAQSAVDDMVRRLTAGEELSEKIDNLEVKDVGLIGRDSSQVQAGIRRLAFSLPVPPEASASYGSENLHNGDGVMVIVSEVIDGSVDSLAETDRSKIKEELKQAIGGNYYDELVVDLMKRADIVRRSVGEDGSL